MEDGCKDEHRQDLDVFFAKVSNSIRQCLQTQLPVQGLGAGNTALSIKYRNPDKPANSEFCRGLGIIFVHNEWAKAYCIL